MTLLTSGQLRAARSMLRWEQEKLAEASGVGISTIRRLEAMDGEMNATANTLRRLQRAFEAAGLEFQDEGRPGVRLAQALAS